MVMMMVTVNMYRERVLGVRSEKQDWYEGGIYMRVWIFKEGDLVKDARQMFVTNLQISVKRLFVRKTIVNVK
jgi:hypothetical protein